MGFSFNSSHHTESSAICNALTAPAPTWKSKRHASKMFIVACRVGGFAKVSGFAVLLCHVLARAIGKRGSDMIGDIYVMLRRWAHRLCSRNRRHASKMCIVACKIGSKTLHLGPFSIHL